MKGFVAAALFLALTGALLWWFSEPQVVKRRIHGLFDAVSFESTPGTGSGTIRASALEGHLAPEVLLETPDNRAHGSYRREDITGGFRWMLRQARESRFEEVEIHSLEIDDDRAKARVGFTARVVFPRYEPLNGSYEALVRLRKTEDGWKISEVRIDP